MCGRKLIWLQNALTMPNFRTPLKHRSKTAGDQAAGFCHHLRPRICQDEACHLWSSGRCGAFPDIIQRKTGLFNMESNFSLRIHLICLTKFLIWFSFRIDGGYVWRLEDMRQLADVCSNWYLAILPRVEGEASGNQSPKYHNLCHEERPELHNSVICICLLSFKPRRNFFWRIYNHVKCCDGETIAFALTQIRSSTVLGVELHQEQGNLQQKGRMILFDFLLGFRVKKCPKMSFSLAPIALSQSKPSSVFTKSSTLEMLKNWRPQ